MSIRILIADDQPLIRTGFRLILDSQAGIEVAGEAEDGEAAIRASARLDPDVVLMDVRMPRVDGVEATRRIVASGSRSRVLVLTTFDLDEYAFSALEAGASGFLLKDVPPEELVAAIQSVARGDAVVSPRITRLLVDSFAARHDTPLAAGAAAVADSLQRLTDREREVLLALADGLSNAEIAGRLHLAEATVKSHVTRILSKLGLRDRVQAVIFAYRTGLVPPSRRDLRP